MAWNPTTLPKDTVVLAHVDGYGTNERGPYFYKAWIRAQIAELNDTIGDELVWLDYIEPMTGQWVYNVPHKKGDIKPFPENKNPLSVPYTPPPRKHNFDNNPMNDTPHGRKCLNCGIHSQSSEADMPCRNA